ncbi:MAG: synthase, subunit b [Acidimicrobiia bacterium]|nr:synthase, subunit b [Acidimicrobiia bacterium]
MITGLMFAAEAGFEAPNKWLPETYEVIFGTIGFLIVFGGLVKFAGPVFKKFFAGRTQRIQDELDRAATTKATAEGEAARVKADLAGAEAEAASIVSDARREAEQVKASQLALIDTELVELRQKAASELESMRSRSLSEVQGSIAIRSVEAADLIVRRNLDQETQYALVERYIEQVGRMQNV